MKMRILAAVFAVVGAATATTASSATVDVNVDGMNWRVGTIDGEFTSLLDTLDDQPWWGDIDLAADFAEAVLFTLGTNVVEDFTFGPMFAYGVNDTEGPGGFDGCGVFVGSTTASCGLTSPLPDLDLTFALATKIDVIPVPASLPLLAFGIGGLG